MTVMNHTSVKKTDLSGKKCSWLKLCHVQLYFPCRNHPANLNFSVSVWSSEFINLVFIDYVQPTYFIKHSSQGLSSQFIFYMSYWSHKHIDKWSSFCTRQGGLLFWQCKSQKHQHDRYFWVTTNLFGSANITGK